MDKNSSVPPSYEMQPPPPSAPPTFAPPTSAPPTFAPPTFAPPTFAPPTYNQFAGGVPPSSPYAPNQAFVAKGPEIVTTAVRIGPNSAHMICPHCHTEINTLTKTQPGFLAYLSGALLCVFGCFLGCCLIPCCLEQCKNVTHSCPACGAYLGRYHHIRNL